MNHPFLFERKFNSVVKGKKLQHMKVSIFVFLIIFSSSMFAQTKMIRHKSHGGTNLNFFKACKSDEVTVSFSNFGMAPQYKVRNSNLDSLILTPEKKIVMITRETCYFRDYGSNDNTNEELWREGKDTVENHPVFKSDMNTDTIREILAKRYFFANPANTVVIVGFEEGKKDKELRIKEEIKAKKVASRGKVGNRFNLILVIIVKMIENICDCDVQKTR